MTSSLFVWIELPYKYIYIKTMIIPLLVLITTKKQYLVVINTKSLETWYFKYMTYLYVKIVNL